MGQGTEVQAWLRGACEAATGGPLAGAAETYATARAEAFPPSAANAYRHLRIHDFSDAVAALPQEEVQVPAPASPQTDPVQDVPPGDVRWPCDLGREEVLR